MDERRIRERMRVISSDGKYVGTVIAIGDTHFQVERGVMIPHDYLADYDEVDSHTAEELVLTRRLDELEELKEPHYSELYSAAEPVND